jgi:hypothetical protein
VNGPKTTGAPRSAARQALARDLLAELSRVAAELTSLVERGASEGEQAPALNRMYELSMTYRALVIEGVPPGSPRAEELRRKALDFKKLNLETAWRSDFCGLQYRRALERARGQRPPFIASQRHRQPRSRRRACSSRVTRAGPGRPRPEDPDPDLANASGAAGVARRAAA